jgi:hypothetical protein
LDRPLDFFLAADQRVDLALVCALVEIGRVFDQRVVLVLAFRFGFGTYLARGRGVFRLVADLGNAVRDVVDDVQALDFLLVQEVHGMRILLAEDRDQHVGPGDFFATRGLHVIDSALQDALETQRGLGIALVAAGQHGHGFVDDRAQVLAEFVDVGTATAQHGRRGWVFQ